MPAASGPPPEPPRGLSPRAPVAASPETMRLLRWPLAGPDLRAEIPSP
jgi:hypothetical protein